MDLNLSQNRQEHYKSVVRTFSCADGKMKHVEESDHYMIYTYHRFINVIKYVPIFNPFLLLLFFKRDLNF